LIKEKNKKLKTRLSFKSSIEKFQQTVTSHNVESFFGIGEQKKIIIFSSLLLSMYKCDESEVLKCE
jgi:hypothetical protein